ncbi:amidohydrolase [Nocardia sp. NEAU-G5]|uniref:Amidohydrolase n=1 Tax=Nocardia albiluteola TaxID=2842303 RepID=A0ABS6B4Y0_9NOCA|nr:amidohydrolase family protein [Nocardia albiluteola]MBU3064786.1 amidohydrolase [Nocardia albiluteola]
MTESLHTVDMHAHVWLSEGDRLVAHLPGFAAQAELDLRRAGPASAAVSADNIAARRDLLTDAATRLRHMDRTGVDVQVVSVSPTQFHPWAEAGPAWDLAQAINVGVARHCARSPGRLIGLGVAPLRHPEVAVAALEDAVHRGLRGVEISSHAPYSGRPIELSEPALEPLWTRAEQLGALIFLHPWGCTLDERLDRWYLSNSIGQPVEHAVALAHLILSGVLDRHPDLHVLAAHGGGYLPAQAARLDFAWHNRPDARSSAEPPSSYLRRMWFDSLVYTPDALRHLVTAVGPERVVLGSDYPFDMGVDNPGQRLDEAGLDAEHTAMIRCGNASQLGVLSGAEFSLSEWKPS